MKYSHLASFIFIYITLMVYDLEGAEKNQDSLKVISTYQLNSLTTKLDSITQSMNEISKNTEPTELSKTDFDEYVNITLGMIAAIGTFLTVLVIYLDTRQNRINTEFQLELIKDLIRHFYRNMAILGAIKLHLENKYNSSYPSEEHILKFKVLPEDLRINRFSTSPNHYGDLHKLEMQLRNFNIEVDVTLSHLKNEKLSEEIKRRDLDLLEFKFSQLTKFLVNLLRELKFKFQSDEDIKQYLQKISKQNREDKKSLTVLDNKNLLPPNRKDENYFDSFGQEVTRDLNNDILLEYEVINNIPF